MRDVNCALQGAERVGIFRAEVDVAAGGADGESGNGHALDQDEGIAFHDHAVGVGAAVAFVRVADDIFLVVRRVKNGSPFDPGGETRAAAPAKSGVGDFFHDRLRASA